MHNRLIQFAGRLRSMIGESAGSDLPSESAGRAGEEDRFNELALDLFDCHFELNPVYRRFCTNRGVESGRLADWRQIPALPSSAFRACAITCLDPGEWTAEFRSSGTTDASPARHYHCPESLALYRESIWPWFRQNVRPGLVPGAADPPRVLSLIPSFADAPHSSLACMIDSILERLGARDAVRAGRVDRAGAWALDIASATAALDAGQAEGRPLLILGTAIAFVQLLEAIESAGALYRLPPGTRIMETGGYKSRARTFSRPALVRRLERAFGVPRTHVVGEYGMCELSSQGYTRPVPMAAPSSGGDSPPRSAGMPVWHDSPALPFFRFPPWARVRIRSPETGELAGSREPGLIEVVDLANVASVLALQTLDLGRLDLEGVELIGRARDAEPRGCSRLMVETV
ncbi:MAG TPA: hypothetical protein P5555_16760 [Candidatus Paceibacterota bacterium]|nr:hypothetical protein [Verrucomicrobiota bacterium]HOX03926.1 hypothetical protein [Verrucomicrobiota bacterium]HRZ46831.1 hypothetical protein [Candidatus Paceibacterota bacterium]HRZ92361.1 hypothetical protein [Candidatus Paceibacterota bacterium]